MKKTLLLLMLSILLIPCYVKAESIDNNTNNSEISEENNLDENTQSNEDSIVNENSSETNEENSNNTQDTSLIPNAVSGVLMDATTGEIIFEKIKMNKMLMLL